jgi:hypothetical protein
LVCTYDKVDDLFSDLTTSSESTTVLDTSEVSTFDLFMNTSLNYPVPATALSEIELYRGEPLKNESI